MKKWLIGSLILCLIISTVCASTFHYDERRTGNFTDSMVTNPVIKWRTNLTGLLDASPVYADGRVYITNWFGWGYWEPGLYCLNSSGDIIWRNENITGGSTVTIHKGLIYVGDISGKLYCVNASDGVEIWNKTLEGSPGWYGIASSSLVYNDTIYITTFSSGTLHALHLNGSEKWSFTTSEISPFSSPAAYNGNIYFAGGDGLYCLNENGEVQWRFNASITNTPSINYGKIFFTTEERLYAINMNGEEVWNASVNGTISTPATDCDRVYTGSKDGILYCFNSSTGEELWNFTANGKIDSSPALSSGIIYFATNTRNGTIYALDAFSGELIWSYSLNPPEGSYYNIMSSPFVADGKLLIGADDGYLYCFSQIIWKGDVKLGHERMLINLKDGSEAEISGTSALSALIAASNSGRFNVTVVNSTWGLYVESIADIQAEGMEGWMYSVNGEIPAVGVADYELSDGDTVDFFYGSWGVSAKEADYRVTVHVNVMNILWNGTVELLHGNFSVIAKSGKSYEIDNLTALGALNAASLQERFNYTLADKWYETWRMLFVDSIYGIENNGTSGWMYWVNYPQEEIPMVGANNYEVKDGDVVYWYYSESMNDTPSNSSYVVKIVVKTEKVVIEEFDVSNGTKGGNATAWINLTALDRGWYVIVVSGTNNGESIAGISTLHVNENEKVRIPVIIAIPQQVPSGEYRLYTGVYRLDYYPDNIITWYGSKGCEVN